MLNAYRVWKTLNEGGFVSEEDVGDFGISSLKRTYKRFAGGKT